MPVRNFLRTGEPVAATFAGRSALLMTGNLVKLGVQLAVLILYSRSLPLEDYGKYQSAWLFINVFGVISLFGLPSLLLSAGSDNISEWIRRNKIAFVTVVLVLHLAPVTYLFTTASFYSNITSLLLYLLMLAQNFSIIRETLAIKHNRQNRFLAVQVVFNLAWLLCHWLIIESGYSLPLLLSLLTGLCLLKGIALPWYRKDTSVSNPPQNTGKQWMFLGLFDVVGVLFKWVDKWVILLFVSVAQFAIYFNGSYEIPIFTLFVSAAGSVMIVELSGKTNIHEHAPELFRKCMCYLAIPVIPAFLFLVFYHEPFFLFIFGDKYAAAIPVFFVALFVIPVRICHFTAGLQAMHRNDIVVKGAFLDLALAILLMFGFYPALGLPGLALAFVLSTWVQAAYYLYHTAKLLNKPVLSFIPLRYLATVLLISIIVTIVGKSIEAYVSWDSMITGLVLCACLVAAFSIVTLNRAFRRR